jgi:hypothetical protein
MGQDVVMDFRCVSIADGEAPAIGRCLMCRELVAMTGLWINYGHCRDVRMQWYQGRRYELLLSAYKLGGVKAAWEIAKRWKMEQYPKVLKVKKR